MLRKASRRRFLRALVTVAGAAGATACGPADLPATLVQPELPGPPPTTIAQMLRDEFAYLDLSQIDLEAFGQEFKQRGDRKLLAAWESQPEDFGYALKTQFLMSTDFFWNNADEGRPLTYRRYFDLYDGCQSPFAELG